MYELNGGWNSCELNGSWNVCELNNGWNMCELNGSFHRIVVRIVVGIQNLGWGLPFLCSSGTVNSSFMHLSNLLLCLIQNFQRSRSVDVVVGALFRAKYSHNSSMGNGSCIM
jgi:hypothetical protein